MFAWHERRRPGPGVEVGLREAEGAAERRGRQQATGGR
jgi:hypothetical protein